MRRSKLTTVLCFCLACSVSQAAFAGKKGAPVQPTEPVRAEGAFYPDQHVMNPKAAAPDEAQAYNPYLLAGVGGLFTAVLAGGLAFVFAGRRIQPGGNRAGAR